jgi:putative sigma-54 modulation protein
MDIIVRGKHFDVPAGVEERAQRKLSRLAHYLPLLEDATTEVDVSHEKAKEPDKRFVVHVTVSAHGVHLQAEERAGKPETAVDQVAQALTKQARKHKDKIYGRTRAKGAKKDAVPEPAAGESPALPGDVSRVKRFAVRPMTVAEAQEEMALLKHDFFLFHDAEAGRIALLYRRKAGDLGLIVPETS